MNDTSVRTIYDRILEILSLISLAGVTFPLFHTGKLDSNTPVPVHFNIHGEADRWGGLHAFWVLPVISIILYIIISYTEKHPKKINYPVKATSEDMAKSLHRLGVRTMRHVKPLSLMLLAYLNNAMLYMAINKTTSLNKFILIAFLAGLFITLAFYIMKMLRLKHFHKA
jgi:hypothetical protein